MTQQDLSSLEAGLINQFFKTYRTKKEINFSNTEKWEIFTFTVCSCLGTLTIRGKSKTKTCVGLAVGLLGWVFSCQPDYHSGTQFC